MRGRWVPMIDLTEIISAILALLAALITSFLIPLLKRKIEAEKLDDLLVWVRIGVNAAEMLFKESGLGAEKKAYVIEFLAHYGFTVDEELLSNVIEAAVLDMKSEL